MTEPEMFATELTYEGPAGLVSDLAEMLKEEGLQVSYRPPYRPRALVLMSTLSCSALPLVRL